MHFIGLFCNCITNRFFFLPAPESGWVVVIPFCIPKPNMIDRDRSTLMHDSQSNSEAVQATNDDASGSTLFAHLLFSRSCFVFLSMFFPRKNDIRM